MEEFDVYAIDKQADVEHVKCPTCGGNMEFDPTTQNLSCPFCGNKEVFTKDTAVKELDVADAFQKAQKWDEASVLVCDNCGARVIITTKDVATECPYCGTTHVRESDQLAGIKPNAVYPFTCTYQEAEALAKKWAKRRIFAPRRFKKNIEAKNLRGVYEPCFTFDSRTSSRYDGRLGKRKTRTVRTKNGTRTETYIEWRHVSGTIDYFFDDIHISAGSGIEQKVLDRLLPFRADTIAVYDNEYLAGFTAKHYEKGLDTAWGEAKSDMDQAIRRLIMEKHDCDVCGSLNVSTYHNDVKYKYLLMPVYNLNYNYKKKSYRVNVNGNTGKVVGKTPVSFWRVLIAVVLGLAVAAGVAYLFLNA